MKKIVITGAESTGKSTMAQQLSEHFKIPLAEEFSRQFLVNLERDYNFDDLSIIAKGQLELEKGAMLTDAPFIICDTGLLVLKIWSEYKFGRLDSLIAQEWTRYHCDLFILPHYDIPFEEDPLRENPNERHILFQLYKDTLEQNNLPFIIVTGNNTERNDQAQKAIKSLLLSNT